MNLLADNLEYAAIWEKLEYLHVLRIEALEEFVKGIQLFLQIELLFVFLIQKLVVTIGLADWII